jgi:hypothetical protein
VNGNPLSASSMERINALYKWTLSPTDGVDGLKAVLAQMPDEDLIYTTAIYRSGESAGRIAWVEYARRKGYFEFEIRLVQVSPKSMKLLFEAEGGAVHSQPVLEMKVPS